MQKNIFKHFFSMALVIPYCHFLNVALGQVIVGTWASNNQRVAHKPAVATGGQTCENQRFDQQLIMGIWKVCI
jgi:hypothetical protein